MAKSFTAHKQELFTFLCTLLLIRIFLKTWICYTLSYKACSLFFFSWTIQWLIFWSPVAYSNAFVHTRSRVRFPLQLTNDENNSHCFLCLCLRHSHKRCIERTWEQQPWRGIFCRHPSTNWKPLLAHDNNCSRVKFVVAMAQTSTW